MNLQQMIDKANRTKLDTRPGEAGKPLGVVFRTGAHLNRKRDKRHLRRVEKAALRDF